MFEEETPRRPHIHLDSVQAKRRTRRRYQETDGWISFYSPSWPSVYQLVTGILFFYLLVVLAKEITPRLEDSAAIQQLFSLFQLGGCLLHDEAHWIGVFVMHNELHSRCYFFILDNASSWNF